MGLLGRLDKSENKLYGEIAKYRISLLRHTLLHKDICSRFLKLDIAWFSHIFHTAVYESTAY